MEKSEEKEDIAAEMASLRVLGGVFNPLACNKYSENSLICPWLNSQTILSTIYYFEMNQSTN